MRKAIIGIIALLILSTFQIWAQRKMENLGRGVVAVRTGTNSAFISWRLLGTEPRNIGFNLYRLTTGGSTVKLNAEVLTTGTNFTDNAADLTKSNSYFIKTVWKGIEGTASASFTLASNQTIEPCLVVPLKTGSQIHFVWVGDLDGDGEYDYVVDRIDWTNGNQKIEAYKKDGTIFWTIDLGIGLNLDNISPGPTVVDVGNWDGLTVYDMDGDGKAEVLLKTANGVTFGDRSKLTYTDPNIQFVSVINGLTGAERARAQIPNNYLSAGSMGCSMGIGYLNGITPSLVTFLKNRNADGSFNRLMCAWDFDGTNLGLKWKTNLPFGASYSAHGADGHQMRIVDYDGDGKDDIGEVAFVVKGEDGSLMYDLGNQGVVHGDRWFVGKLDPNRPGLQGYGIQQDNPLGLMEYYYDAGTGEVLWKHSSPGIVDVGRGVTGDIDPRHSGYEVWSFSGLYNGPENKLLSTTAPYPNYSIWWDGDVLSENLNDTKFEKWDYKTSGVSRLLTAYQYESALQYGHSPMFYGDILGDWREEVIFSSSDYSKLVIFTTPTPSDVRLYTLAQNPEYRNCMTVKGYYQSNMLDYFLGANMTTPPTPPIQTATCTWMGGSNGNNWDLTQTPNWLVNKLSGSYNQGDDVLFDIRTNDTIVNINDSITPSLVKVITPTNYKFQGTGTLSGSTGLLKAGNGTLSLNSRISYDDTTRLEEGSLYINNNLTNSTIKAFFASTLGGSGTIYKPVIFERGINLAPGSLRSVGTLTFKAGLKIPSGAICLLDITDDSTGLSKPSDKIVINGDFSIADTLTLKINKINSKIKPGTYPLLSYSGSFLGDLSKIGVDGLPGQKYLLKDSAHTIFMIIKAPRAAASVVWNGQSNLWDLQNSFNWNKKAEIVTFVTNDSVTFNQVGKQNPTITINEALPISKWDINTDSANYTFTGIGNIGGSANLQITGKGTTSLLTTNSYSGTTSVSGGQLLISSLADAGVNSSIGSNTSKDPSAFVLTNAHLQYNGTTNTSTNKGLTINGENDTLKVTSSGNLTLQGVITGTANLVKTGAGILNIQSSVNTFIGNTIVKGGVLSLGDEVANVNGVGTGSITLDGGTLTMLSTESDYTTFTNEIIVPTGSTGTLNTDGRCDYKNKLTGGGTLTVNLTSTKDRTVFFGNWSAFTGTINAAGAHSFRIGNSYGYANAAFNLNDNTSIYHGGTSNGAGNSTAETVNLGAISGTNLSTMNGENWIVGSKNTDATFNGTIAGNSITKVGSGSWTLTNANTYTGTTTINAGTLIVDNTTGSGTGTGAVAVNNGGVLAGTGYISQAVNVGSGAAIAPGDPFKSAGFGRLTVSNAITLASGSTTQMQINKTVNTKDRLVSSSAIRFGGTLALTLTGTLAATDTFRLFVASSITGAFSSITPSNPGAGLSWDTTLLRSAGVLAVKGKQVITFNPIPTQFVGDSYDPAATVSTTGAAIVYTSGNSSVATIVNGKINAVGVGTTTITATVSGQFYYRDTTASQTIVVSNLHKQTLTFDPINKTYGDVAFTVKATSDSALTSISYSIIEGADIVNLTGNSVTLLKAGTAKILAYQAGTSTIAPANAWATITANKAPLSAKADNVTIVYGQTPVFTCTMSGFVNGESASALSGMPTYSVSSLKAGVRPITIGTTAISSYNYIIIPTNGTLTVDSAALTLTAVDKEMTYGSSAPAFTYTVSGFVNGETVISALSGKPAFSVNSYSAGNHDILLSKGTLDASNYKFVTFNKGTLTVDKVDLAVSATNQTMMYGNALPAFTYQLTGLITGETASVLTGSPVFKTDAILSVGIHPICIEQGSLLAENYNVSFTAGELLVEKATLSVQADNQTMTYGNSLPMFTYSITGFKNNEDKSVLTGAPSISSETNPNAEKYPIAISSGTLVADNYNFTMIDGTLSVEKALLSVTAQSLTREKGQPNPTFVLQYQGFLGTDNTDSLDVKPEATCMANDTSIASTYPIEVSGGEDNNYSFLYQNGILTVIAKPETRTNVATNADIAIYPNPVSSILNIKTTQPATIEIYNISGIKVAIMQSVNSITDMNMEPYPAGIYLVKLISDSGVKTYQVIKK